MKWLVYCKLDNNLLFEASGKRGDIATKAKITLRNAHYDSTEKEIYCNSKDHPEWLLELTVREHWLRWVSNPPAKTNGRGKKND